MQRHREDDFNDIVAKAMKGRGIGKLRVAELAGVAHAEVQRLVKGEWLPEIAAAICPFLDLHYKCLERVATETKEEEVLCPSSVEVITSSFSFPDGYEMQVNAYLLEIELGKAVLVDTGVDAALVFETLNRRNWSLEMICLTHAHRDHVHDLPKICDTLTCHKVYIDARENFTSGEVVTNETSWSFENGDLRTVSTCGHSPGGRSWIWESRTGETMAFVGDALFSGSVGGVERQVFERALTEIRQNILSLPQDTLLFPGHGFITTVGNEKKNNPFFAN